MITTIYDNITISLDELREWLEINVVDLIGGVESDLVSDAASGQKNVEVTDGSQFTAGDDVRIIEESGDEYSETNVIASISTDTLTMENNLVNTYETADNAKVVTREKPSELEDTELERLIDTAKRKADNFCQNEFKIVVTDIIINSPAVGDTVKIDGNVFTYETSYSEIDREFSSASELADLINSNIIKKNGEKVGITYIDASVDADTVTLQTDKYDNPTITADSDEIDYQYRIEQNIPVDIEQWIMEYVARMYNKRINGLDSLNISGSDSTKWNEIDYSKLQPYKRLDYGRIKEENENGTLSG